MTAAARHPDAQAAVHTELDAVVGNDQCLSRCFQGASSYHERLQYPLSMMRHLYPYFVRSFSSRCGGDLWRLLVSRQRRSSVRHAMTPWHSFYIGVAHRATEDIIWVRVVVHCYHHSQLFPGRLLYTCRDDCVRESLVSGLSYTSMLATLDRFKKGHLPRSGSLP